MKTILSTTFILLASLIFNAGIDTKNQQSEKVKAPTIVSPANNTNITSTCIFTWTSSEKHSIYEIWIADNINFKSCEKFVTKDTSYNYETVQKLALTKYAKVRAWKSAGIYSSWSNIISVNYGAPKTEMINYRICNGDCANCTNPCGRRSSQF